MTIETYAADLCPQCGGSGDIEQPVAGPHGEVRYEYVRCSECDGAGSLEGPVAGWMDPDYLYKREWEDGR